MSLFFDFFEQFSYLDLHMNKKRLVVCQYYSMRLYFYAFLTYPNRTTTQAIRGSKPLNTDRSLIDDPKLIV